MNVIRFKERFMQFIGNLYKMKDNIPSEVIDFFKAEFRYMFRFIVQELIKFLL